MRKIGITLGIIVVIAVVFIIISKSYYPTLPVDGLSAKETIKKLKKSDEKIVEIGKDNNSIWYITKNGEDGISTVDENIKKMISAEGWQFKDKMGSGLFFEKDDKQLIVTTQMWTKKYVLIQVHNQFNES